MIANINSTALASNSSTLLKLSQAAQLCGIHPQTLRRMADRGSINAVVLPSGHRFFQREALAGLIPGEVTNDTDAPEATGTIPVILCARVSSVGQSRKRGSSEASDLERQVERLESYIGERWGKAASVTKNVRVASGCNFQSKELHDLMRLIWSGRYRGGFLVATYFDRILRIGWELVELACQEFGVEMVYINEEAEEDDNENSQMVSELLAIMTLYTSRASAKKTIQTQRRDLEQDDLAKAWKLYHEGYSYEAVAKILRDGGATTKNGEITVKTVMSNLKRNKKVLEQLYPASSFESSFTTWANVTLETSETEWVSRSKIIALYTAHCKRNGIRVLSHNATAADMKTLNWTSKRGGSDGRTLFGVAFCGE